MVAAVGVAADNILRHRVLDVLVGPMLGGHIGKGGRGRAIRDVRVAAGHCSRDKDSHLVARDGRCRGIGVPIACHDPGLAARIHMVKGPVVPGHVPEPPDLDEEVVAGFDAEVDVPVALHQHIVDAGRPRCPVDQGCVRLTTSVVVVGDEGVAVAPDEVHECVRVEPQVLRPDAVRDTRLRVEACPVIVVRLVEPVIGLGPAGGDDGRLRQGVVGLVGIGEDAVTWLRRGQEGVPRGVLGEGQQPVRRLVELRRRVVDGQPASIRLRRAGMPLRDDRGVQCEDEVCGRGADGWIIDVVLQQLREVREVLVVEAVEMGAAPPGLGPGPPREYLLAAQGKCVDERQREHV